MIDGTNFSGSWVSPIRFWLFTIVSGKPYDRHQLVARASVAAFDAEYGLLGRIGDHSICRSPAGAGPYTSSVEICRNAFRFGRVRAYCSRCSIRSTLLRTNGTGSVIDRSTCDWAA